MVGDVAFLLGREGSDAEVEGACAVGEGLVRVALAYACTGLGEEGGTRVGADDCPFQLNRYGGGVPRGQVVDADDDGVLVDGVEG
jgi:hypothetical protein